MSEVPRIRRPLTELELAIALRSGHGLAFGASPTPKRLAVAWAQCALEHAHGQALDNFCIGNVTASANWTGDHYVLHVAERVKKKERPGDGGVDVWKNLDLHFRSYGATDDPMQLRARLGACGYFALLGGRYKSALELFDSGDASKAAYRLGELNYFTASPANYAKAMVGLVSYYERAIEPHLPEETQPTTSETCTGPDCDGEAHSALIEDDIAATMAKVAASLAEFGRETLDDEEDEYRRNRVPDGDIEPPPDNAA